MTVVACGDSGMIPPTEATDAYFESLSEMQTAIAEHDYETAAVRARENLVVIPAWIEEEGGARFGVAALRHGFVYVGGATHPFAPDTGGVLELDTTALAESGGLSGGTGRTHRIQAACMIRQHGSSGRLGQVHPYKCFDLVRVRRTPATRIVVAKEPARPSRASLPIAVERCRKLQAVIAAMARLYGSGGRLLPDFEHHPPIRHQAARDYDGCVIICKPSAFKRGYKGKDIERIVLVPFTIREVVSSAGDPAIAVQGYTAEAELIEIHYQRHEETGEPIVYHVQPVSPGAMRRSPARR